MIEFLSEAEESWLKIKVFSPLNRPDLNQFFFRSQTNCEETLRLLKAENALLRSQLADVKAMETDSQATIQNQEIAINSLKKEKEVCSLEFAIVRCTRFMIRSISR